MIMCETVVNMKPERIRLLPPAEVCGHSAVVAPGRSAAAPVSGSAAMPACRPKSKTGGVKSWGEKFVALSKLLGVPSE